MVDFPTTVCGRVFDVFDEFSGRFAGSCRSAGSRGTSCSCVIDNDGIVVDSLLVFLDGSEERLPRQLYAGHGQTVTLPL